MINIINCGVEEFKKITAQKKVVIYGAGRALESSYNTYFIKNRPIVIIDKNPKLIGKYYLGDNMMPQIESVEYLKKLCLYEGVDKFALFISTPFYAAEIIEELNQIAEIDGLSCYVHLLMRNINEGIEQYSYKKGKHIIPKRIHYIWLGNNVMPDKYKAYIEGWHKLNPDYEIIKWSEDNYNIGADDFVTEAYSMGKYSKASNYMRLKIIYEEGGIYLDTDVELLKPLDVLLNNEAFFCMGNTDSINNGCGFGAIKQHSLIQQILQEYEGIHYSREKGGVGDKTAHSFFVKPFEDWGFRIENRYQEIKNVVLYPKDAMSPLTFGSMPDFFSNNTLAIHHEAGSWKSEKEKEGLKKMDLLIKKLLV